MYSCNIVNNANSWWKTSDGLNLEAFNGDFQQVQPLCWKRLTQLFYMYQVLQFHMTIGCSTVVISMSLHESDDWAWRVYICHTPIRDWPTIYIRLATNFLRFFSKILFLFFNFENIVNFDQNMLHQCL